MKRLHGSERDEHKLRIDAEIDLAAAFHRRVSFARVSVS
jgi:hypothetical protein